MYKNYTIIIGKQAGHGLKGCCSKGDQRGFSLMELMIVIGILAILWAISPNYRDVVVSYGTTSVSNSFAGTLKRARSEAMRIRQIVAVCATTDGLNCNGARWDAGWIVFPDVNNDLAHANDGTEPVIISTVAVPNFNITDNFTAGNLIIRFLPSGLLTGVGAAGGTIAVCESSNAYPGRDITLNAIGRARIAARACP